MAKKLLIFGGSGHAKDVISTAQLVGYDNFNIVTTDGSCHLSGQVAIQESAMDVAEYTDWDCIIAIGNNQHRQRFYEQYAGALRFVSILSPTASISSTARIGKGSYVGAFASIGPDSLIGDACIVNTQAVVGHDAKIGHFSQVGPGACLCGHVEIGQSVFVGARAVLNNGSYDAPLTVPDEVHIGMGCRITESVRYSGIRLLPKPNYIAIKD